MLEKLINKFSKKTSMITKSILLASSLLLSGSLGFAQNPLITNINSKQRVGQELKKITIKSDLFNYQLKYRIKTNEKSNYNEIKNLISFQVNSTKKEIAQDYNVILIHGFTVNAKSTWMRDTKSGGKEISNFVKSIKINNKKPKDYIYIDYNSYAKRPNDIADDVYHDLAVLVNKYHFDFKKTATVLIAHSNGTLVASNLLQNHPDLIQRLNMYALILLGPPLKGANPIARNTSYKTLSKVIKPMQDFTGKTDEMRKLTSNFAICLPKLIVYGDVTQKNTEGRYILLHPIIQGKDDGLVDAKATDITTQPGWLDMSFGGIDLWTGVNLDHTDLRNSYKVARIINNYTSTLNSLHDNNFNFASKYNAGNKINKTKIDFNHVKFNMLGNNVNVNQDEIYKRVKPLLIRRFNLKNKINELLEKDSGFFSSAKCDFDNFKLFNQFNIIPQVIYSNEKKIYELRLNGDGKVTGTSRNK